MPFVDGSSRNGSGAAGAAVADPALCGIMIVADDGKSALLATPSLVAISSVPKMVARIVPVVNASFSVKSC